MANLNPPNNINRLFQTAGSGQAQQGTGYTNLNKLFEANKNNQLGQKVAGDISGQIGGVKNQLNNQQQEFQKESEANKLDTDTNKAERESVLGRFTSPSTSGGEASEEDVNKFQKFRSGEYAGPQALKDTSGLSNTASGLAQQTSAFSPSGTQELLRRSVGGDRYTQGQSRLDSLLLDRSALTPLQRQAQGLNQEINRANLAAQGQAQLYKNQAQQFGTETTNKLNEGLTGIDTSVQGQLASAQQSEKDRQAKIQAIQNFAAGKAQKLDETGKPVVDQYGNPVYTQDNIRGTEDKVGQLDYLRNLLSGQGAQQEELSKLFGTGNIAQQKSAYDTQQGNIRQQELGDIAQQMGFQQFTPTAQYSSKTGQLINPLSPQQTALNTKLSNYISANSSKYENSQIGKNQALGDLIRSGQVSEGELSGINSVIGSEHLDPYNQQRSNALNQYKTNTGLAGEAALGGNQEDLYSNLAKTVANSQQAQNLTEQGVASDAQRGNYAALAKLLGQTTPKYTTDADKYQAGNLLLNPDQIRKSLGY